ncbi:hypothetical protein JXA32_15720 [Candidatus Sumerlaeota bacterium]|nr:hypothetical protein [Candidatus Sumerlaeota bacterium]
MMFQIHIRRILLTGVWFMASLVFCATQPDKVEVHAELRPQKAEAGDPVEYIVTARWDANAVSKVSLRNRPSSDTLELLDYQAGDARTLKDGRTEAQYTMRLLPLTDGAMIIPPAEVEYIVNGEDQSHVAQSQAARLEVSLTPPEDAQNPDIRERLAQASVAPDRTVLYAILAGGAVLAALAGVVGWLIWRKWNSHVADVPREPLRPLEEIVREQLDQLARGDLLIQGKYKEFFLELSRIMRFYAGQRFNILALDMTSYELEEALADRVNQELHDQLREFNSDCDLAKFAKHRPKNARVDQLLQLAHEWVRKTSPSMRDGKMTPSPYVKSAGAEANADVHEEVRA